jgi:hypothetical protein
MSDYDFDKWYQAYNGTGGSYSTMKDAFEAGVLSVKKSETGKRGGKKPFIVPCTCPSCRKG